MNKEDKKKEEREGEEERKEMKITAFSFQSLL